MSFGPGVWLHCIEFMTANAEETECMSINMTHVSLSYGSFFLIIYGTPMKHKIWQFSLQQCEYNSFKLIIYDSVGNG